MNKCAIAAGGALLLSLCAETSPAGQDGWIRIGTVQNTTFDVKYNSLRRETRNGVPVVVVVGRTTHSSKKVTLMKWSVSARDCERQMGKLAALGIDDEPRDEREFVFDCGSMVCLIAEAICNGYTLSDQAR